MTTARELQAKHCQPCEGGVPIISAEEAERLLGTLSNWELTEDGKHIRRRWTVKDFASGMAFLQHVADLAEHENHHPDVHLCNYRDLTIELSTHAVGGLSENDFILAAKIDELPVELREPRG